MTRGFYPTSAIMACMPKARSRTHPCQAGAALLAKMDDWPKSWAGIPDDETLGQ